MLYRFRVILDAEEDVFRDLEIMADNTLEDLHNVILQSFGFDGTEMASFYISDEEWKQGEEISQFDMAEDMGSTRLMNETSLDSILSESQTKLLYVYDFLTMWTFMVELAEIAEPEPGLDYPNLMYVHGQVPATPPERDFKGETQGLEGDYDDEFGNGHDDDFDIGGYDDLPFDENWN